jgi:hypothetical protein
MRIEPIAIVIVALWCALVLSLFVAALAHMWESIDKRGRP